MTTDEERIILDVNVKADQALEAYELIKKRIVELNKEMDKLERAHKKETTEYTLKKQELKALTDRQREYQKEIQNSIKANRQSEEEHKKVGKSLNEMKAQLSNLTMQYNRLTAEERKADLAMGEQGLTARIRNLTKELSKAEQQVGNFRRNVGNYPSAFSKFGEAFKGSLLAILGPAALAYKAVAGLISIGKQYVEKNKEFEQANANLAAILGTTRDKIQDMTLDAKRLGETTIFTASEVTQLQTELAKLGFSAIEIKNAQTSVLKFAQATGASLADAASVAGSAMRAFGMDASEMERIVSTLAVSTTKSALTFEKLATAMPIVAPVAKSFNFSIEETTALLGKLSDSGFDATMSATATRNILLNLANSSGKLAKKIGGPVHNLDELADALKKIDAQGISLAETFELTDKRSVAAFNTFLKNADSLKTLKENITDVGDNLDNMVNEQMSTLQSSTKMLSSAWEALLLSFSKTNGVLKGVVDWLTKVTRGITNLVQKAGDASQKRVNNLVDAADTKSKETYDNLVKQGLSNDEIAARYINLRDQQDKRRAQKQLLVDQLTQKLENGDYSYTDDNGVTYRNKDFTDLLHKTERQLASAMIQIKKADEIIGLTAEKVENPDGGYDKDADKNAAKAAAKAEREWKLRLEQMYTMLKKTEDEGADMIARRYDMAIATAEEAYDRLDKKTDKTEEDKQQMLEFVEYQKALEKQKEKDIEMFHERSVLKRIKRDKELIAAEDADELKNWLLTDTRRNEIEMENAKDRIKAYKEEMEAEEGLTEDSQKKIQSMIIEEEYKIQQLQYKNLLNERSLKLTEFTLTEQQTYEIKKEYLEKELEAVKGNIDREAKIRKEMRELEVDHIEKQMNMDLADYGLREAQKLAIKRNYLLQELEAVKGNADKEREIMNKLAALNAEKAEAIINHIQEYASAAMEITSTIANAITERENAEMDEYEERQDKKKESLEQRLNDGLITQEQYEVRVRKMEAETERKQKELEIKQAKREKAISLMEAIVNTALGIAKAVADSPWTGGLPASAIVAATGAAQIAAISMQKIPTAGRGMYIQGPSHANGGVLINAEGGEAIINKKATAKYAGILSAINQSTGGVPIYGAGGDVAARMQQSAIEAGIDYGKLAYACAQMNVQVAVTDINKGQAKMAKVQQRKTY